MTTRVVLLGHPVAHSLSPRMQNAAFAAAGLHWEYSALDVLPEDFDREVRRLVAEGVAGANVTIPHKRAAAALCDEAEGPAVNTLVFEGERIVGFNTDKEIVAGIESACACLIGAGGAAEALLPGLHGEVRQFSRRGVWPPSAEGCDLIVNATPVRDELLVQPQPGQIVVELAYGGGGDRARQGRARGGLRGRGRAGGARAAGSGELRALDRRAGAGRRHAPGCPRLGSPGMTLDLATAGESHGPALVAILSGLPAGLVLDRAAIDADLRRRQQGYGRSPRQQIETDEVEVLAGLRHGRTLGTPLALVVRNRDHRTGRGG